MINNQFTVHGIERKSDPIRDYVTARYGRWLDYSRFHCSQAGIPDESVELLNECLLSVLKKDADYLLNLYKRKRQGYTELDYFVLKTIKLNAHSLSAPYRWKNKPIQRDTDIDFQRLRIIDEQDEESDRPAEALKQMRLVRYVFNALELSEFERAVFEFRFINGENLSNWTGLESQKKAYSIYRQTSATIQNILFIKGLIRIPPKHELNKCQCEQVKLFLKTRKIHIKTVNN